MINTEIRTNESENHTYIGAIKYDYDLRNNLKSVTMDLGGKDIPVQKYGYAQTKDQSGNAIEGSASNAKDNLPTRYKLTPERYVDYEYDTLNRLTGKTLTTGTPFSTSYIYKSSERNEGDDTTYRTTQLSKETIGGVKYSYSYDKIGNITAIKKNDSAYRSYEYDSTGQLIRENNKTDSFTKYWNYDSIGNIESVKTYSYTTSTATDSLSGALTGIDYKYSEDSSTGWDRLLTELEFKTYNSNGGVKESYTKSINYDRIGNPVSYLDHDMTWFGRQLEEIKVGANTSTSSDNKTLTFIYGADGLRRTKKVKTGSTTVKSEFVYANGNLAYEKRGSSELFFFYDSYGHLAAIRYYEDSGSSDYKQYYAITNSMGDVLGFVDGDGTTVATYEYDAWGNWKITKDTTSVNIATLNPIRYRGYYLDTETGFYYLQSRYYDPAIGRFLNADAAIGQIGNVQGTNMFAYCFNNPVNMSDPTGNWPNLSTIFTVVAVAAVAVATVAVTVATCGTAAPALAVAGGGIIGGISAGAAATAASVATGAMIVAGVSTAAAVTSAVAEKAVEKTAKQNNSVYVLKDDTGTVQYVGRTTDVAKRAKAHEANPARAGLKLEVIQPNLNYVQARAVEQAAMAYYHTINTANKMNNQINGISPFNPKLGIYKEAAVGMLGYTWNQVSNEILYWTGI